MKSRSFFNGVGWLSVMVAVVLLSASNGWTKSAAERYPNRGIEIICGWGVGGGSDTLSRKVAHLMSARLGVPVHVTNAPGVAGLIGLAKVDAARADGYTVGYLTHSGLLRMIMDPRQKTFREFQPLCSVQLSLNQLYVRADAPWKNFGELMKEAKSREITTAVSSPKGGDEFHIAFINLKRNTKFVPVPYKKPTERYAAQLGGHVELQVEQYGDMRAMIEEGKIRPILHFGPKRDPRFPEVESSWEYDLPVSLPISRGYLMKNGTDERIMEKLENAFEHVYNLPEFQAFNKKRRVDKDSWRGREAYRKMLEAQWQTAEPIIKTLGWIKK